MPHTDTPLAPAAPAAPAPIYFILAGFGDLGRAYVERDPAASGWDETIDCLVKREYDNPLQVIEVNLAAGTSRDVTMYALREALLKVHGEPDEAARWRDALLR